MTKTKRNKKIRKGDTVIAITGNDKGQTGEVLAIVGKKAVVQGFNIRKKHMRKTETSPQGARMDIEKPVDISNLMICVDDNKPKKLRVKTNSNGERELYYKDGSKDVTYRTVKKS